MKKPSSRECAVETWSAAPTCTRGRWRRSKTGEEGSGHSPSRSWRSRWSCRSLIEIWLIFLFYPGQASLMVKEVSPEILNRKVIFVKNVVLPVVFICWWDSVGGDQLIEQQIPWGQSTLSESTRLLSWKRPGLTSQVPQPTLRSQVKSVGESD